MSRAGPPFQICIGTSGWTYKHWKGKFYPADLPTKGWLGYYQSKFDPVELNGSFYRQPKLKTFQRWRESSPENFLWAVKAYRGITHFYRLKKRESLDRFLDAVEGLGAKLGVILLQLPPRLKFDEPSVRRFRAGCRARNGSPLSRVMQAGSSPEVSTCSKNTMSL